jgi:hypothetical protein
MNDTGSGCRRIMIGRQQGEMGRIHIISRDKGWAIKKEGALRASRVLQTKQSAIDNARKLNNEGDDIVIHNKDGSVQRWEKS